MHILKCESLEELKCSLKLGLICSNPAKSAIHVASSQVQSCCANLDSLGYIVCVCMYVHSGPPRGLGGQIQKVGPHKMDCVGESGGTPPGNFEILHTLKCVLEAPEALFSAHTVHIYLQVAVFDKRFQY